MVRPQAVWQDAEQNGSVTTKLTGEMDISPVIAQILSNRGITTTEQVTEFLTCELSSLTDPFGLKDMELAVSLVLKASAAGEKILVYGDYDVDGVTSTAVLLDGLAGIGCAAGFKIPDRFAEGYGLNKDVLAQVAEEGYSLVITVDCGISAVAEIDYANSLGLKVIVTDHHQPPEVLPNALAIINPKQPGCTYPFKDLAGVGVAFKLVQALHAAYREIDAKQANLDLLDLVSIGTVADMVPLLGENRVLVKHGLSQIPNSERVGLQCLLEVAGLQGKQVNAGHVGFQLGPRINASGRISDATIAVQLLRSHDLLRARETAVYLDAENRERQEIETVMLSEALAMLADFDGRRDQVIVLAKEGWHPGVIGIVASRLVEKFYCPAILISLDGGEGKGSGRSIQGFDLYQALQTCSDILVKFGGHRQAAGLTIKAGQVDKLRERLNSFARLLPQEFYRPRLHIDARVEGEQITPALIGELSKLEPFGYGNPNPVLRLDNLNLLDVRQVGKDHTHLKVKVKCGNRTFAGIGFGLGEHLGLLEQESTVEAAFTPVFNEYNGHKTIQLQLKDIRAAGLSSQPVQTLIANFHRLTSAEQDVLTLLAQGSSCSAPQNCSLLFPLTAAVNQVLAAGKASVVVYPRAALAKSIANLATRIFPQSGQTVPLFCVDKMVTLPEATGIFIIGNDSIAGDWARIEQLGANLGLIVLDSLDVPQPAKLDRQFPILRSQTSAELVQTMAPNRERLGRLYKLLASLNTTERRFLGAVLPQLAERLAENTEFVNIGLQIFEELHIIKRENSDSERIFYFQVPKEKLNLLNSSLYRQGLEVLQDYAGTA